MKAILLARGLGRRMQAAGGDAPLTPAQQAAAAVGMKGMMPIGDAETRPFLDHVLSALADAGCREVCLVVAPDHDAIRRYYEGDGRPSRISVSYAVQPLADGTARAVLAAEGFAGRDPFLVLNADNVYPADVVRALIGLDGPGLPAFERQALIDESGFPAARVAAFAWLEVDSGRLRRIIEKPGPALLETCGPRTLVSMNAWRFDHRIFDACRDVALSARGEYELPDAVALALARGIEFRAIPARGAVLDLSRRTDVAEVTRRLAGRAARP